MVAAVVLKAVDEDGSGSSIKSSRWVAAVVFKAEW